MFSNGPHNNFFLNYVTLGALGRNWNFLCHTWGYHVPQPLANEFNEMGFNPLKLLGPLWRARRWLCHPACFGSFRSGPSDSILINDAKVNQNLPKWPIDEAFKPLYQKSENLVFFAFRAHKSVKQELADLRTQLGEKVELLCPSLIYYCIHIYIYTFLENREFRWNVIVLPKVCWFLTCERYWSQPEGRWWFQILVKSAHIVLWSPYRWLINPICLGGAYCAPILRICV